jgi:hypothetical protein
MTACPLTVIPPKCTGVPITQPVKIILLYKSFFLIFKKKKFFFTGVPITQPVKKKKIFLVLLKPFLISISIFKN